MNLFSTVTDMDSALVNLDALFEEFLSTCQHRGEHLHLHNMPGSLLSTGRGTILYTVGGDARVALSNVVHGFDCDWYSIHIGTKDDVDVKANVTSDALIDAMPRSHKVLRGLGFTDITATGVPLQRAMTVACKAGDFGIVFSFERSRHATDVSHP